MLLRDLEEHHHPSLLLLLYPNPILLHKTCDFRKCGLHGAIHASPSSSNSSIFCRPSLVWRSSSFLPTCLIIGDASVGASLPTPWFIYAFMGVGILICCISFIGHIGAEAINGCCLCCYAVLAVIFILLEVGLVTFIAMDHQWEKDIPYDSTGQLDGLRKFIEDNVDVFKWVGITFIALQVLSVVLATILRSLVSRPRDDDDDIDEEYSYRTREPLITPYNQASGSSRGDSDIWSSRMRAKYGLNNGDPKSNSPTQAQHS